VNRTTSSPNSSLLAPTSLRATTQSPARLTASATLKLPRWALVALCLLYILPGLIGRDPWKSEDASAFGVMWTMATGAGYGGVVDWLLPNVAGAPVLDSGPLMYWVGASFIALFGHLMGADLAARLATVLFFFVAVTGIWYATYLVGRRPAAQPAALAFGGQPEARDYGRVLADGALLILLATIGLLIRAHESSSDVAMLAMLSAGLYGMARSLEEPKAGAGWIALSLVGLVLSRGPAPALAMALLWVALIVLHADFKMARRTSVVVLLPLTIAGLAIWPLLTWIVVPDAGTHIAMRLTEWWHYFDGIDAQAAAKYLRTLPWSTWLAWPLAAWGVWSWRDRLRHAHLALPGGFVIAMLLVLCSTSDTSDGQLLLVLPGLVMLAAIGLPTLRRGGANAFDWFSLLVYSIVAIFIWFAWFAKMTGAPAGFARSIARLTPGVTYEFRPLVFGLAIAATIAWLAIVRWRIVSHPKVLWRSVVLASAGLILAWTLTSTLFINTINASRTYRDVSSELVNALGAAQRTPERIVATRSRNATKATPTPTTPAKAESSDPGAPGGSCVATDGLGLAQRASFAWFGGLHFSHVDYQGNNVDECDYLLRQDLTRNQRADTSPANRWKLLWEGRRPADRDERFRLYRKTGSATTRGAGDAIDRSDQKDSTVLPLHTPVPAESTPNRETEPSNTTSPQQPDASNGRPVVPAPR
jgi:4-amino-4-deoxy-L-arabinose transferase-like glycosyltransferase